MANFHRLCLIARRVGNEGSIMEGLLPTESALKQLALDCGCVLLCTGRAFSRSFFFGGDR